MTFCRSIYVKKVMKLLAFIFEQPSYNVYLLFIINILNIEIIFNLEIKQVLKYICTNG